MSSGNELSWAGDDCRRGVAGMSGGVEAGITIRRIEGRDLGGGGSGCVVLLLPL